MVIFFVLHVASRFLPVVFLYQVVDCQIILVRKRNVSLLYRLGLVHTVLLISYDRLPSLILIRGIGRHFWSICQLNVWRVKLLKLVKDLVVNEFPHVFDPYVGQADQSLWCHNHLVTNNAIFDVPLLPNIKFNVVLTLVLRIFRNHTFFALLGSGLGYFLNLFKRSFVS
jgi:hypothetical protein